MDNKFDLQLVLKGKPIETVMGRPAEFISYDPTAVASLQVTVRVDDDVLTYYTNGTRPRVDMSFDLRMKAVEKQVDLGKLPVDTRLLSSNGDKRYANKGMRSNFPSWEEPECFEWVDGTTIAPNQPWTVWLGGECPIPDGLEFEYMTHDCPRQVMVGEESASAYLYLWCSKLMYAYRPTGKVFDGWKL
jgi:hypothetical protein